METECTEPESPRTGVCFSGGEAPGTGCGVASMLMDEVLRSLDKTKEISVSTFRADDEKGTAPRALYEKYGVVADALIEELNYPNQKFILYPVGAGKLLSIT